MKTRSQRLGLVITLIAVFAITSLVLQGCGGSQASNPSSASNAANSGASSSTGSSSSAAAFRFVSWGDSRDGASTLAAISSQVAGASPNFTIYTGDLEPSGFTTVGTQLYIAAMNGNANNGLSAKTFSIRGNHDSANTTGWQAYYNIAGVANTVGATHISTLTTELTYSLDYQNAHFVGIDVPGDASLISAAQISWLDADLAAAESRGLVHAFIYFHGPIYCVESQHCTFTGSTGSYAPAALITVLNNHPIVTATFHGHEHLLAETQMNSSRFPGLNHPIEQIITGAAGAPLYACDIPGRADWCDAVNGFATVDIAGKQMTVNYYQLGSSTPLKTVQVTKP
jgi:hypothetical protein